MDATPGTVMLMSSATGDMEKINTAFAGIVTDSFKTHPMRHQTDAEQRRRISILIDYFRIMRGEKKWPLDRALQEVRFALEAKLDGREFEWPPEGQVLYGVDRGVEPIAEQLRKRPPLICG
ncbi:hypothetical protein EKK58_05680 [Candidatus Dependentiae bacterium]|nr:MAG: hypothetical protein EKK58_05680 [Candidatus Dependentiae bacterium]